MKQRVRVVGIIQRDNEILILKKSQGRKDGEPIWELPTGKIKFGEQPEEAIDRTLDEYLGIEVTKRIQLQDVVTFVALHGSSQLNNLYIVYNILLPEGVKIRPKERYTVYKFIKKDEVVGYRLDEASAIVLGMEGDTQLAANYKEVANSATVYVDGCSRGNPGPAGVGYYIVGENGQVLAEGGEFIGFATSRVAEYQALKRGCLKALELGLKSARFISDNLMIISQMNGIYKVKNGDIKPLYDDVRELAGNFDACAFIHVAREQNTRADAQANLAVDRQFGLVDQ